MKRFPAALLAGLAVAVVACDDASGPGDGACAQVTPLSIDAAGSPPNFTWAPACGVAKIEVTHFDSDGAGPDSTYAALWIETPNESNSINPPISYGVVPTGADEVVPEQLLISGHHYRVAIYVWDAPLGDYFLQASGEFDRP